MRVWDKWVCMCEVNHELWIMGWYDLSMKIVWDDSWNWNDEFGMNSTWDMKELVSMWHGNDMRWSSIFWVRE